MNPMSVYGLLLCFTIGSVWHLVNGQSPENDERIAIVEEASACLSQGTLSLSCPDNQVAMIRSAVYFKSLQSGCHTDSEILCEQEDVRVERLGICFLTKTLGDCDISMSLSASAQPCHGYQGETFFRVTYSCQPYVADAISTNLRDMCDMETAWQGSLLFLISPDYPEHKQTSHCGCSVSVHPRVQLALTIASFDTEDSEAPDCDMAFYVQSDGVERRICSENYVQNFKPIDMEFDSNVYFKFENFGGELYRFYLVLQVHHSQNVTVQCGRDYSLPSEGFHVSSISPPGGSEPQRSPSKEKTPLHWPIITAVVGVACVVLIIVVAVLLFCRKKFHRKRSDSTRKLAYDNNIYMSSEQVAIDRDQPGINMSNINETKSAAKASGLTQHPEKSDKEAMGVQSETYLPCITNSKEIAIEDKESAIKKHPALAKLNARSLGDLKATYPDIPESILKELGCQSEAIIAITKPNVVPDEKSASVRSNVPIKSLSANTNELPKSPFSRDNPTHSSFNVRAPNANDQAELKSSGSFSGVSTGTDYEVTPYSSMGDLSVEDRAKLMAQQLKAART